MIKAVCQAALNQPIPRRCSEPGQHTVPERETYLTVPTVPLIRVLKSAQSEEYLLGGMGVIGKLVGCVCGIMTYFVWEGVVLLGESTQ